MLQPQGALCTDSALGVVAPKIGRHFVKAEDKDLTKGIEHLDIV